VITTDLRPSFGVVEEACRSIKVKSN